MSRSRVATVLAVGILAAMACASDSGTPTEPAPPSAPSTARYRVTFDATWNAASHPVDFPADAHFSPLVGGTHDASATFWREAVAASDGIKDMAERGRTTPLDREVMTAIAEGRARFLLTGGGISQSPGTVSLDFDMTQSHPLVTIVSMIAPSPDWFVGVAGLPLFDNGQWIDLRTIELGPWDAGTDSGSTFTSPDLPTAPRALVSRILTAPLSPDGRVTPLGTLTFRRIS